MLRFTNQPPAARLAWTLLAAALATANMVAVALLADASEDRSADLWIFHGWFVKWLNGVDVISAVDHLEFRVDYPPWAFITFLPFGLLPPSMVMPAAIMTAIVVMPAIAFTSARVMSTRAPFGQLVLPALLVLCWGAGVRTIVMFTTVPLLFGLLAVWCSTRVWPAGMFLGLALAKPHIALPFLFWTIARRHYRVVGIAALVVAIELVAYSVWASANPLAVTWEWLRTNGLMHWALMDPGITSLRAFVPGWLRPAEVMALLAVGGFIATWKLSRRVLQAEGGAGDASVLALGSLVVLLCFYHYWEDLLLLAPVFMAVYFGRDAFPPYGRWAMLALMQVVLMLDLRQRALPLAGDWAVVGWLLEHSYRLLILTAAVYFLTMVSRTAANPVSVHPAVPARPATGCGRP